jgi:hypothetical protein
VRVTISGTITDWAKTEALIVSVGGVVEDLTIVPPPVKLGDVLEGGDAYKRTPVGTVVKDELNNTYVFKDGVNHWVDNTTGVYFGWDLSGPRTVVFLPDVA